MQSTVLLNQWSEIQKAILSPIRTRAANPRFGPVPVARPVEQELYERSEIPAMIPLPTGPIRATLPTIPT